MLTKEQLSYFHALLAAREQELQERLAGNEHFGLKNAAFQDSMGELANYDNHPADHGTEQFERGKDLALNEHVEQELVDVRYALETISSGRYGICEECQQAIPYDRLEAMPTATRCVQHAIDKSVSDKRPIEEQILKPSFGQFVNDEVDDEESE